MVRVVCGGAGAEEAHEGHGRHRQEKTDRHSEGHHCDGEGPGYGHSLRPKREVVVGRGAEEESGVMNSATRRYIIMVTGH
jgi:hypothetical protein